METSAHLWAGHPAVASQEAATLAEREAVDGVVTEELLLTGGHQGEAGARLVLVGAGHVPHVGHGEGGEGPLEGAVTQERVVRHQEHPARPWEEIVVRLQGVPPKKRFGTKMLISLTKRDNILYLNIN